MTTFKWWRKCAVGWYYSGKLEGNTVGATGRLNTFKYSKKKLWRSWSSWSKEKLGILYKKNTLAFTSPSFYAKYAKHRKFSLQTASAQLGVGQRAFLCTFFKVKALCWVTDHSLQICAPYCLIFIIVILIMIIITISTILLLISCILNKYVASKLV